MNFNRVKVKLFKNKKLMTDMFLSRNGILSDPVCVCQVIFGLSGSVLMIETVDILDFDGNIRHVKTHGSRIPFHIFSKYIYLEKNRFSKHCNTGLQSHFLEINMF